MKIISKRDPVAALNENFLTKLQEILMENLSVERDEIPTIEACLEVYVKHEEKLQAMVTSSVKLENFKRINEIMKEM